MNRSKRWISVEFEWVIWLWGSVFCNSVFKRKIRKQNIYRLQFMDVGPKTKGWTDQNIAKPPRSTRDINRKRIRATVSQKVHSPPILTSEKFDIKPTKELQLLHYTPWVMLLSQLTSSFWQKPTSPHVQTWLWAQSKWRRTVRIMRSRPWLCCRTWGLFHRWPSTPCGPNRTYRCSPPGKRPSMLRSLTWPWPAKKKHTLRVSRRC